MEKPKIFSIIMGLIFMFTIFSNAYAKDKPILMRCATVFPPVESLPMILKQLEATIPKETNDRVKFEFYPAATLYNQPDALVALQSGDLEMAFGGVMVGFVFPEWEVITSLPLLFNDLGNYMRFLETSAYQNLGKRMKAKGMVQLTKVYPMGANALFNSKRPLKSPKDFQGLKVSVPPSKIFLEAINQLGAKAVSIPVPELPAALETGMVDATPNSFAVMPHIDLPRLMPYTTMVPINMFALGLIVSSKWWDTVPNDLQAKLDTIFSSAVEKWKDETLSICEKNINIYKATSGTVVTHLSDVEIAEWRKALKPLYDDLKKKPNLREIIDAAEKTR
jgi:C4-dicarboxylate-binding protein DctP